MKYKVGDRVKLKPEAWASVLRRPEENLLIEVLAVKQIGRSQELLLSIDNSLWDSDWVTPAPKIRLLSVKRVK